MRSSESNSWVCDRQGFRSDFVFTESGMFTTTVLPPEPARAGVVVCPPLLDDFTRNYRREVLLARRLAHRSIAVVRFHYRTTGNSLGDDRDDLVFSDLVDDAREALALLVGQCGPERVAVFGARFGALIAARLASEHRGMPMAFWDPVADGATWLKQVARDEQIAAIADQGARDPSTEVAPYRVLEGERLPHTLVEQCETLRLESLMPTQVGPVFVAELSASDRRRAPNRAVDTLQRVAPTIQIQSFPEELAWSPGHRTPPRDDPMERWPLLDDTVAWLHDALLAEDGA